MKRMIAVVIAGVLINVSALWFAVVQLAENAGRRDYLAGDYAVSLRHYELARALTPDAANPWSALLGAGTNQIRLGDVAVGLVTLEEALVFAPKDDPDALQPGDELTPECRVRMNMSVGAEILGDNLAAAGDADAASLRYDEAASVLAHCAEANEDAQGQQEDVENKAEQARAESAEQAESEGDEQTESAGDEPQDQSEPQGGSGDSADDSTDASADGSTTAPDVPAPADPKAEELDRRNEQSEDEYRRSQHSDGYGEWDGERW